MVWARPSQHFLISEDSENGKVQKVSPKGINKARQRWAAQNHYLFMIFTDNRDVLRPFLGSTFRHLGGGLARISFRDLVFDIGKWGFWAPRSDEIVYSGIPDSFHFG